MFSGKVITISERELLWEVILWEVAWHRLKEVASFEGITIKKSVSLEGRVKKDLFYSILHVS